MCSKNILTGLVALLATFSIGVMASMPFAPFSASTATVAAPARVEAEKRRKCPKGDELDKMKFDPAKQEVVHLSTNQDADAATELQKPAKRERPAADSKR